jgi:multidrug resistance efflux pump
LNDPNNIDISELLKKLGETGENPSQFLTNLLAGQCLCGDIQEGAILNKNTQNGIDVLAIFPLQKQGTPPPEWLLEAVEILRNIDNLESTCVEPLNASDDQSHQTEHIAIVPLKIGGLNNAAVAMKVSPGENLSLEQKVSQAELIIAMLNSTHALAANSIDKQKLTQVTQAMEILSAVNQQQKFVSAAMSFCNENAARWQCERVSLGIHKSRYVQIAAISHTEDFSRKMKLAQDIESAMEECLDQDIEVLYPAEENAAYIWRSTKRLSQNNDKQAVLSVPIRTNGDVFAVLTLEKPNGEEFGPEQIEAIRLTCELCAARLKNLFEYHRWFGATLALKSRNLLASFLGPKHTFAKIAAILIMLAIVFLTFAKGQFRPKAPFVIEATYQQVIPAPFDGYLKEVNVDIGQNVIPNISVLATLDTAELRLQLASAKADKVGGLKQESAHMRDNEIAQAQIARANADKAQAQIDLLSFYINQANIVSPIEGIVVKGDLRRQIGAPVKTGDLLFEVCPLEAIRAEIMMPEDLIFDIKVGQKGRLATASYPDQPIDFVVERINPIAEVINQRNVFKVRVQLVNTYTWMRPGMEGVAKVSAGKRPYIWIWTRKITNWIRMKFWL